MAAGKATKPRGRPRKHVKGVTPNPRSKTGQWHDAAGRPTKLSPDLLSKAVAYYEDMKSKKQVPYIEELAVHILDTDRHVIARWNNRGEDSEWLAKQTPEKAELFKKFSSVIKGLATMQLLEYKKIGVSGKGNNPVLIFLMKADHNMIETQRLEHGGIGGAPIEVKPIEVLSTKNRKPAKGKK